MVWVVRDGKLHSETVRVVDMSGDQLLVEQGASGLKPGDRVVVSPLSTADEGMLVSEGDTE
ncbi:hypothetical protein PM8797T_01559 [Gimesia maris DSM 8797]|nr:hypothetical protein PM8797T_01559 [Gimesia maris DSM 8797]